MTHQIDIKDFLDRNRIDHETWEKSNTDWAVLEAIAADHRVQHDRLRDSAELFGRVIQRFQGVHSVRWRIKNTEHLLEKIIRKRAQQEEKYKNIDASNYFEIITDLVGIRAIHLFKDDCFLIDSDLRAVWSLVEEPIAYVRQGDVKELTDRFGSHGFLVKEHPAGYRSVHYVCATQPLQRKVFTEIQVRTIFEEGWSEIDHRVRYPNFSDDELVAYFLTIFNRLAGSADEMGTFVQGLTGALREFDAKLVEANRQKEEALSAMDAVLSDLEALKRQDAETKEKVISLQKEVKKLRQLPPTHELFSDRHKNALASIGGIDSNKYLSQLSGKLDFVDAMKRANIDSSSDTLKNALEQTSVGALAKALRAKN